MAIKNYAKDIIYNMDKLLSLIRYDYYLAKRAHKKIEINSIFINDMIAQACDLVNNGYAIQHKGSYPALYAMSNGAEMKKRPVVSIINDIEGTVMLIKNDYDDDKRHHAKIWVNDTHINSLIAHVRELIVCGYVPSNEKLYPVLDGRMPGLKDW